MGHSSMMLYHSRQAGTVSRWLTRMRWQIRCLGQLIVVLSNIQDIESLINYYNLCSASQSGNQSLTMTKWPAITIYSRNNTGFLKVWYGHWLAFWSQKVKICSTLKLYQNTHYFIKSVRNFVADRFFRENFEAQFSRVLIQLECDLPQT